MSERRGVESGGYAFLWANWAADQASSEAKTIFTWINILVYNILSSGTGEILVSGG